MPNIQLKNAKRLSSNYGIFGKGEYNNIKFNNIKFRDKIKNLYPKVLKNYHFKFYLIIIQINLGISFTIISTFLTSKIASSFCL